MKPDYCSEPDGATAHLENLWGITVGPFPHHLLVETRAQLVDLGERLSREGDHPPDGWEHLAEAAEMFAVLCDSWAARFRTDARYWKTL